jgi:hypothetical protein
VKYVLHHKVKKKMPVFIYQVQDKAKMKFEIIYIYHTKHVSKNICNFFFVWNMLLQVYMYSALSIWFARKMCSIIGYCVSDVSALPISPIFKGEVVEDNEYATAKHVSTKAYTVRLKSRCALRPWYSMVRRFGCQYWCCHWSVLLFHCIQLLNSGWSAIPVKCLIV